MKWKTMSEHLKIVRDIRHRGDIRKAIEKLPKNAEIKKVIPQPNIPSAFAIVFTLPSEQKPRRSIRKPHTVAKPKAPQKPTVQKP